jgi:hypothetical protein
MAAKNDVTGDSIRSKTSSRDYRDNYDKIFRKKKPKAKSTEKIELRKEK